MKFKLRNKIFEVLKEDGLWVVYNLGEGKKSKSNLIIPPDITEDKMKEYLEDYFHEALSPEHPEVERVD